MRLGELLLRDGLVTREQLAQALTAQVELGGRLGTLLVEAEVLDLDVLARALAELHGAPAAVQKHFDAIVPETISLVPVQLATKLGAVPLGITGQGASRGAQRLAVAMIDPRMAVHFDELAFRLGMPVQPAVAPELRILYNLERWYRVSRPSRYLRIREHQQQHKARPAAEERRNHLVPNPAPQAAAADNDDPPDGQRLEISIGLEPEFLTPVPPPVAEAPPPPATAPAARPAPAAAAALASAGQRPPSQPPVRPPQAPPNPTPTPPAGAAAIGRITPAAGMKAIPRPHGYGDLASASTVPAQPARLDAAATAALLGSAKSRDDVGDLVTAYLRSTFACGLVLICKDDMALGWKGYSLGVDQTVIESIAVPLGSTSMLSAAYETKVVSRGAPPAEGAALQTRLWKLLKSAAPSEVIVVPIVLRDRVVNLVYAHARGGGAITTELATGLLAVCQAAQAAFMSLIQAKKSPAR